MSFQHYNALLKLSTTLVKYFSTFQGGTSFVDHFCYLLLSRLFIAALWSSADLLALVCDVLL